MGSIRWLALAALVAAASAVEIPAIKTEDKVPHFCEVVAAHGVSLKGKELQLYQCSSEAGARFLLAADSNQGTVDAVISGEAILKLRELSRPKRQGFFGLGGSGLGGGFASASAMSSAGGGGGGFGGFPSWGGGGFGGGFAGSSASANAGGFGGGFGGF